MAKYFISYNRDELSHLKNKQNDTLIVDLISQRINDYDRDVYFDNIAFVSLDKDIFDNITNWMTDLNTIVLIVSDCNIFYGWTEKELLSAICYERPIYKIGIKKFIKYYIDKQQPIKNIIRKKAKKLRY